MVVGRGPVAGQRRIQSFWKVVHYSLDKHRGHHPMSNGQGTWLIKLESQSSNNASQLSHETSIVKDSLPKYV